MDFTTINWQPFISHLEATLGIQGMFKIDLTGKRPEIISENLVNFSGIMRAAFSEIEASIFNFSCTQYIWGTVNLSYRLHEMGTNGAQLFTFWYHETEGWRFKQVNDNK